ncbi:MAG: hypothetical protein HN796_23830 [Gemmatimonadetes bacterium]|nr:hypothetical protein [Gemmatimonadota bacterium]
MFELKSIQADAIPAALERVERYRLLNEPRVAQSICHDILAIDPDNHDALVGLVLSLTDSFAISTEVSSKAVLELIPRLANDYDRLYYTGVIHERQAKARLTRAYPGANFDAYELLVEAMQWFEQAEEAHPEGNPDAILRWNTCARLIMNQKLEARPTDDTPLMSE